jgi:sugar lactone lactonase YvrE
MKQYAFPGPARSGWWVAGAALVLGLVSCGGGGGGAGVTAPPPTLGLSLLAGSIGGPGNIDGQGATARFNQPRSIAADAAGALYVSDGNNQAIRRIAADGTVTTLASPPRLATRRPIRVALDASGAVYFTTVFGGPSIQRLGADGSATTLATNPFTAVFGPGTTSGIGDLPAEFVFDAAGTIYAADILGHRITRMTADGTVTVLAGSGIAGSADGAGATASFNAPSGLALDAAGNLFVTDVADHTVRKVTRSGVVTTIAGTPGVPGSADGASSAARFNAPQGIAVDAAGTVFVADTGNNTIRRIGAAGDVTTIAGAAGLGGVQDGVGAAARFATPTDLAFGAGGDLFVVDAGNDTIRRVTPSGTVVTFAGAALATGAVDARADAARFATPQGLAQNASGNVFVADTANNVVRRIDTAGNVTTFAGAAGQPGTADGVGAAARFRHPVGLAITPAGDLYVTDLADLAYGGGTVRRIAPDGTVTTFAGDPAAPLGSVRDGVGPAAWFSRPFGIASDAQGTLYVSDSSNLMTSDGKTVRRITPDARVTTIAGAGAPCCTHLPDPDDGTGAAARFVAPSWLAVGPDGNVYVVDQLAGEQSSILRRVTPAGQVTTLPMPELGAIAIGGIAVDTDGSLYFFEVPTLEASGIVIRRRAPDGTITTVAGHPARRGVQLGAPLGSLDRLGTMTLLAPRTLAVTTTGAVLKVVVP